MGGLDGVTLAWAREPRHLSADKLPIFLSNYCHERGAEEGALASVMRCGGDGVDENEMMALAGGCQQYIALTGCR